MSTPACLGTATEIRSLQVVVVPLRCIAFDQLHLSAVHQFSIAHDSGGRPKSAFKLVVEQLSHLGYIHCILDWQEDRHFGISVNDCQYRIEFLLTSV